MNLKLKFFDKESWSFYGTINVLIPLLLFIIFQQQLNTEALIFMSILGMMDGPLESKIIFTGFLNFLVFKPSRSWIIRSILLVISVYLMDLVKYNNKVHKTVMSNEYLKMILRIIIFIWMSYILFIILFPLYKWKKIIKQS